MANYFALAAPQVNNAQVDFSPISNALENYNARARQAKQDQIAEQARQEQRTRLAQQDAKQLREDQRAEGEFLAKQAMAYDQLTDPAARKASLDKILAKHPNAANLSDVYKNPDTAFKAIAADWGMFSDPMKRQKDQLDVLKTQKEISKLDQDLQLTKELFSSNASSSPLQTAAATTNDAPQANNETLMDVINQLPTSQKVIAKAALLKKDIATLNKVLGSAPGTSNVGSNIAGALENLRKTADKYDDTSFENALGPLQGSQPDSYFKAPFIMASRLGGEILNKAQGGQASLSELRDQIAGTSQALAAAIKPLVRKPGEGTWTDKDQEALERIVGNLANAKSKPEFKRRLNSVRDRIRDTFNVKIDFDADKIAGALGNTQQAPNTNDLSNMSNDELLKALGK